MKCGFILTMHNAANPDLNENGVAMANGTRLRVIMPSVLSSTESRTQLKAVISSSNTDPKEVWDSAFLTSNETVLLRYVPGSAIIHCKGSSDSMNLPGSDLFSITGTPIAYSNKYWGSIPGGYDYAGYATFRFVADKADFDFSLTSESDNSKFIIIEEGKAHGFKVFYKNIGTTEQSNVTLLCGLPEILEYVPETGTLTINGVRETIQNNDDFKDIFSNGVNVGLYQPGSVVEITFNAVLSSAGLNKHNQASVFEYSIDAMLITGDGVLSDRVIVSLE